MVGRTRAAALAAAAALLLGGCSRLLDAFVYFPDRSLSGAPGAVGLGYEEVRFPAADGVELHGWWVPGEAVGPCIVFFHGNTGNISHRLDILKRLHNRLGLGVFLFDYRGYGKSAGKPSEAGLYADARGARAVVRDRGWGRRGEILFGRSLGAAVAIQSAVEAPPSALVLESAFSSLSDLARIRHPILAQLVSGWLEGRYAPAETIGRVRAPLLFLHGARDRTVPIGVAWRLYDAAGEPKWFRTLPSAGHDDLAFVGGAPYWEAWALLLERVDAERPEAADARPAPGRPAPPEAGPSGGT
ncbi:MAG: alpha/beta hydrolase [Deferrisomatales bacterium]